MESLLRGRYEQLEVVGVGAQGRVVKARDIRLDRAVALKVRAAPSEADRAALLDEARILFGLPPSPHLPIVREDFFEGDDYVIVMDWVEGTNLERMLHTEGRPGLPPTLVLAWLADAAVALTHLHTRDPPVCHGDVKPANLIVSTGGRVSVVDFGLSSTMRGVGGRGGTPGFRAPERVTGGASTRAADIYSLAATAFALLTGGPPTGIRPPWAGVDPALAGQLEAAIREGLATDPARRPPTAGELVERLRAGWASSLPTGVLTFCFTDVVGSTSLWEAEPIAMSRALVVHDRTIATAVERRGGRLIDAMGEGDSTVSVFDSPVAAVAAAIDLTRDLAAADWPPGTTIRARAALHTGEAEQRDGRYFGLTLNTAARVRGLAGGGQVLVSKDTAALVRDHLPPGAALVDLGPARLRGRSEREQVFALAAPGVDAPPPGTECPYPGLLAFGPDDADRYFGRDAVVSSVIARLQRDRFVAVIGASGSGKSSLLRAGVIPRWDAGADLVTPGAASGSEPCLEGLAAHTERLLVVDQLEELFTQVDVAADRTAFVDTILDLDRPVALALRADFYGSCATIPRLATVLADHHVLLGPMTREELQAAIIEPAAGAGLAIEPGLVELLVNEVRGEPGALPLLAHALRATWEQRDGRTLTLEAYQATGGVSGAIGSTADQVLAGLDPADRNTAEHLLLRLVEPGDGLDDTRRRATLTELRPAGNGAERVDRVVAALASARLVAIDEGTVEVAHEALIREWPQLQSWLADQRSDLRVQRQVTTAAEAWAASGREPSELFRGPRLARGREWLERAPHASALETEFLRAGAEEEERAQRAQARSNRRLRASLIGVLVALVLAAIGGIIAVGRGRQANESRDHADVARLAAVSRSLVERRPDVGLLVAVEAYGREGSAETRSALLSALEAHPMLEGLVHGTGSGLEAAAFTPDGRTLATPMSDGSGTVLWDTATRRRVGTLSSRPRALVLDATISPDGRTLAAVGVSVGSDGAPVSRLQVWDLEERRLTHRLDSPAGSLSSAAFSADGATLVTQGGGRFDAQPSSLAAVVWDTATWTPRGDPWPLTAGYDDRVIALSRDGAVLAAPDGDGATVWDVGTRLPRQHVRVTDAALSTLALNADGSDLALGLESGVVRVVDTTTGAPAIEVLADRDVASTAIEFSADDEMLAVASGAGRTQLFDTVSGSALGPPLAANDAAVNDVSFSDDGRHLATAGLDRTGAIWRLDGSRAIGAVHTDHDAVATELAVSPDGRFLVSGGADGAVTVRDIRAAPGAPARSARRDGEVRSVSLDPDGTRVVSGDTSGTVTVATLPHLEERRTHAFPGGAVWATAVNPVTGVVAIGVQIDRDDELSGGLLAIWDPARDREVAARIADAHGYPVAMAWSPDGRTLAVSSDNNVVRLYRAGKRYTPSGDAPAIEDDTVTALAFAPDGRTFAMGLSSGAVRQYDADTRRPAGPALRGLAFEVGGVAYSPNGTVLAATSVGIGTSRLWDAQTGTPIGDELVAGRVPFTVRTMGIDERYASRPAFSHDGATLFTPVVDGSIVAWDLRADRWAAAACELAGRGLTEAEWLQYVGDRDYRPDCAR